MSMPDRLAHVHEPEGLDIEPFMEGALEEVVETILSFGEYPQPRAKRDWTKPPIRREFDLYDFLVERIDPSDLLEYFILSMTDQRTYGTFSCKRDDWYKKVEKMLMEDLKDSDMVTDLATNYAEEE